MHIKRSLWNAIVVFALLFLIVMLGVGHRLGPLPHFLSLPKPPSMPSMPSKQAKFGEGVLTSSSGLGRFVSSLSNPEPSTEAKSRALAWVLRVNVPETTARADLVKKMQSESLPAYQNPEGEAAFIFIGPYIYQQEAEQAQKVLKNSFGLSGDVVKFDPLVTAKTP